MFVVTCIAQAQHRTDTLSILHVNDTHGNLSSSGPRATDLKGTIGGIARAATVIGMTRMVDPSTLLLHAGDAFLGDLTFNAMFGVAEQTLLQELGFDAMTMGNHEFDLTPELFFIALNQSGMTLPVISSNCILLDSALLPLRPFINKWIVKDVKGVKVGIFGMTTPEANVLSQVLPSAFLDTLILETAAAAVDSLRNLYGCTSVIMLSHLGISLDRQLAYAIPGIDAVIGGHDHALVPQSEILIPSLHGTQVPVVQAGAFYHDIGKLRLTVTDGRTSFLDWTAIPLDQSIPEEPSVAAVIDTLQARIEQQYGLPVFTQQIATVSKDFDEIATNLPAVGKHDTPVGNLVTDAIRSAFATEITMTAGGSTAQPLSKGPIVANDLMRMIGYGFNEVNGLGFRIVRCELPGMAILAGLQYGLTNALGAGNDEFLVQVSGMTYDYSTVMENTADGPIYTGTITGARIGTTSIDPTTMYSVATNEFVFSVLKSIMEELQVPISNVVLADSVTEFEVVMQYVSQLGTLTPKQEGRILCTSLTATPPPASVPTGYRLGNYPNPVRSEATLVFELPKEASLSIHLFDNLGRKVKELFSDTRQAGRHTLRFNPGGLASGMYTCVLTTSGARVTKNMVIVR